MSTAARLAASPFEFYTLALVARSGGQNANTLGELQSALETCSDESIYHHTVAALQSQYGQSERMMNDYARWAFTELKRADLGERLTALDAQEFEAIAQLREALCGTLFEYLQANPGSADEPAAKPFSLCEGLNVRVPLDAMARNLAELRTCIERMSGESFYLHFVAPRAKPEEPSNDFSVWLRASLGLQALAAKIEEIDAMGNTLEEARQRILALIDQESGAAT